MPPNHRIRPSLARRQRRRHCCHRQTHRSRTRQTNSPRDSPGWELRYWARRHPPRCNRQYNIKCQDNMPDRTPCYSCKAMVEDDSVCCDQNAALSCVHARKCGKIRAKALESAAPRAVANSSEPGRPGLRKSDASDRSVKSDKSDGSDKIIASAALSLVCDNPAVSLTLADGAVIGRTTGDYVAQLGSLDSYLGVSCLARHSPQANGISPILARATARLSMVSSVSPGSLWR